MRPTKRQPLPKTRRAHSLDRVVRALEGLVQECEYSASSGLPFNATGQEWTQLRLAKELLAKRPNCEISGAQTTQDHEKH